MKELKRAAQKNAQVEEELDETPRILSSEEKRELILAHARSQTGKDRMQRMTVWAGVLVVVAGIAVGWWWTVGSSIQMSLHGGSSELEAATKRMNEFTQTVKQGTGSLQQPLSPTGQANAAEFSGIMKAVLDGNQPKPRNDLMAPYPKGVSSSTQSDVRASSTQTEPTQLIDTSTPGLTPDQQ